MNNIKQGALNALNAIYKNKLKLQEMKVIINPVEETILEFLLHNEESFIDRDYSSELTDEEQTEVLQTFLHSINVKEE